MNISNSLTLQLAEVQYVHGSDWLCSLSRKITLPPHISYYCRIHDSIKEHYTANSRELLLHDQLMQWQNSAIIAYNKENCISLCLMFSQ